MHRTHFASCLLKAKTYASSASSSNCRCLRASSSFKLSAAAHANCKSSFNTGLPRALLSGAEARPDSVKADVGSGTDWRPPSPELKGSFKNALKEESFAAKESSWSADLFAAGGSGRGTDWRPPSPELKESFKNALKVASFAAKESSWSADLLVAGGSSSNGSFMLNGSSYR